MLWEEHRSAVCHPGPVPTDSEEARACHCDADSDDSESSLSSARTGTHCDIIGLVILSALRTTFFFTTVHWQE